MPRGDNHRKLNSQQISEIVRRYTTQLPDGTWEGTSTLARAFGVRPLTINRWLRLNGVTIRSATEAHSGGKRCKPITVIPEGEAPNCACGCGELTKWNQPKKHWNKYAAGHYQGPAPYKDETWLRAEYIAANRSAAEIAAEFGVGVGAVMYYLRAFAIPRRNGSDAHLGRQAGPLNPAWKGGVADWPYWSNWKTVARKIRDRDKWTCQDCGEQRSSWGVHLHVHHIDVDKFNNNPSNLISLCAACHRQRHRREGLGALETTEER